MKRFSKIVSVMRDLPLAMVISPMNCACRSVGKPGKGAVVTSTGAMPAPLRLTRMPELVGVISAPVCGNHVERGLQQVGPRAFEHDVAAGHGDRHGIGAGLDAVGDDAHARAPDSASTPSMVMVGVPAPLILAPMALRQSARLTISGSRAAFSSTVSPLASEAAIISTWVAPTETFGNT